MRLGLPGWFVRLVGGCCDPALVADNWLLRRQLDQARHQCKLEKRRAEAAESEAKLVAAVNARDVKRVEAETAQFNALIRKAEGT